MCLDYQNSYINMNVYHNTLKYKKIVKNIISDKIFRLRIKITCDEFYPLVILFSEV